MRDKKERNDDFEGVKSDVIVQMSKIAEMIRNQEYGTEQTEPTEK